MSKIETKNVGQAAERLYLEAIVSHLKQLRIRCSQARNTLKVKCASATLAAALGRAQAMRDLILYGAGERVTSESMLRTEFDPIVEYWAAKLGEGDE